METPERVLRRLEFKIVRRLDGFLFGDYRGVFYGPSLDLAEVREYQPGDEVRRIDWNVTARMSRIFVRQYLEERELTAWLAVDLSPSMRFGTRRQLKRDTATEFSAVAAYIVTRHGDKAGLIGFPGRHVCMIAKTVRRRSLLFVVSDFQAKDGWEQPLRELVRRHEVIAVWVTDPAERELPDVGGLFVRDPETGEQVWVDTSDRRLRETYRNLVTAQEQKIRRAFRHAMVDTLELSTAEPLVGPLLRFISRRKRRGRWNLAGR